MQFHCQKMEREREREKERDGWMDGWMDGWIEWCSLCDNIRFNIYIYDAGICRIPTREGQGFAYTHLKKHADT